MLKVMIGIVLGLLLAWLVGSNKLISFPKTVIKTVAQVLQSKRETKTDTQTHLPVKSNEANAIAQDIKNTNPPATEKAKQAITEIDSTLQENLKADSIKEKSEKALLSAREESRRFEAQYKKPKECYDIEDNQTRIRCANAYMKARAAFNKAQQQQTFPKN